jgi:SAM-dependent methyltransferase
VDDDEYVDKVDRWSATEKWLDEVHSLLNMRPGLLGHVLDFGCGHARARGPVMQYRARTYTGVDVREGYPYGLLGPNSQAVRYGGRRLPFEDETFDTVLLFHVLPHVTGLDRVMQEIRRVLKTDGVLLIAVANKWFDLWMAPAYWVRGYRSDPTTTWYMDHAFMHRLAERGDLFVDRCVGWGDRAYGVGPRARVHCSMVRYD